MLSYRHAFHAGNHADVLKHLVLMQTLAYFGRKDKPYWYIDTHAGAGIYSLESGYATQNAEYRDGIGRLWERPDLPESVAQYVELVRSFNPGGKLRFYPGSPACARPLLREQDRMRLFELHPSDYPLLKQTFQADGRKVLVEAQDGFAGLKALLPPPPRRAVVLIDPPYEQKQDYGRVVEALKDSLQRFPTGSYLVWYPLLQRPEPRQLQERLRKLAGENWLQATLTVRQPSPDGYGMHGSGIFMLNPPWTLPAMLQQALPFLRDTLRQDAHAAYTLESEIA